MSDPLVDWNYDNNGVYTLDFFENAGTGGSIAPQSSLSYEDLLREKDERIRRLEAELGARNLADMRLGTAPSLQAPSLQAPSLQAPSLQAPTAASIHGTPTKDENFQSSQPRSRKRPCGFIEVSFDTGTNQRVKKSRIGQGRQGKLTDEGLKTLKQVKQAGGQCLRCKTLKKKVSVKLLSAISIDFRQDLVTPLLVSMEKRLEYEIIYLILHSSIKLCSQYTCPRG